MRARSESEAIHALHRYWLWANDFRSQLHAEMLEVDKPPTGHGVEPVMVWLRRPFQHTCYWLAALYVVVEGWKELGLTDTLVDKLLEDEVKVASLKRFRHGVYHFQRDYFDARVRAFLHDGQVTVLWADSLHTALSTWFLEWFRPRIGLHKVYRRDDGVIVIETSDGHARTLIPDEEELAG